jgi:hypothetical protein
VLERIESVVGEFGGVRMAEDAEDATIVFRMRRRIHDKPGRWGARRGTEGNFGASAELPKGTDFPLDEG